jgi:hypothetical protein
MAVRSALRVYPAKPTVEGAGVRLYRAFGYDEARRMDPFLMLDDFHSGDPDDYMAGFTWHPHRGFETVTYMVSGAMEHEDNMGNRGTIRAGDVQWMTAGSGIIHQETPLRADGFMQGFQLWVNLPRAHKMTTPRYRSITADQIPEVKTGDASVRVVSGTLSGVEGPVRDLFVDVEYLDVNLPPGTGFTHETDENWTAFAYTFKGAAGFSGSRLVEAYHMVELGSGDRVTAKAGPEGARFLLISGRPLGEPIAWRGSIVMSTQTELGLAYREIREGTFIKAEQRGKRKTTA